MNSSRKRRTSGEAKSLLRRGPAWRRALLAGLMMAASVPPWGWWPLSFVGLALWVESLAEASVRQRARLSAIASAAWLGPATVWMADLSIAGWPLAIAGFAAMHAAAGALTLSDERRWVVFPAAFVLAELLRWSWPFGGVPLATMAMAQVSGPLAGTARLGGAALLTGLTAVAGVTLAMGMSLRLRLALRGVIVLVGFVVSAGWAPRATVISAAVDEDADPSSPGQIQVAAIQGGGIQNTRADVCAQRGVFERHYETSRTQITGPVDLIVWPEDVVHLSPEGAITPTRCGDQELLASSEAHDRLSGLARDKNAVLVAGFFGRSPDREANLNYVVAYDAQGRLTDEYHKRLLVPFGEYVPLRSLAERVSDDLPRRDVRPGPADAPAILHTPLGPLGVSISWEVFFDRRARNAIGTGGGQILLNPTNGSSYWLSVVQSQQVAASRLRAIATDRWVIQAAPTGFSAVIDPDGTVVERTGISESKVIEATVELRRGDTLAVRFGAWPVVVVATLILAQVLVTSWLQTRRRSG